MQASRMVATVYQKKIDFKHITSESEDLCLFVVVFFCTKMKIMFNKINRGFG